MTRIIVETQTLTRLCIMQSYHGGGNSNLNIALRDPRTDPQCYHYNISGYLTPGIVSVGVFYWLLFFGLVFIG